jgi:hypothetical protein
MAAKAAPASGTARAGTRSQSGITKPRAVAEPIVEKKPKSTAANTSKPRAKVATGRVKKPAPAAKKTPAKAVKKAAAKVNGAVKKTEAKVEKPAKKVSSHRFARHCRVLLTCLLQPAAKPAKATKKTTKK